MSILVKFNLVLISVFLLGLAAISMATYSQLEHNARQQVEGNARIMEEAALAVRGYTSDKIKPLLQKKNLIEFRPETVPSYSATEIFNALQKKYPDYTYKQATLNPTNPRDKATEWEEDVINKFRNKGDVVPAEITNIRSTSMGRSLYIATPLRATTACLSCHSTPERAPATMIKRYGPNNGFNWHENEVVGAQIISVPMSLPEKMARQTFWTLIGAITLVFGVTLVVLNVMLTMLVIRPVTQLSQAADRISQGDVQGDDLPIRGKDEIAGLAVSFNRMQRSLKKAMSMLEMG